MIGSITLINTKISHSPMQIKGKFMQNCENMRLNLQLSLKKWKWQIHWHIIFIKKKDNSLFYKCIYAYCVIYIFTIWNLRHNQYDAMQVVDVWIL